MNVKIGAIIKELRKRDNITQERLAESIGVTSQAISKWESENGYPDIELIVPIADFFNVSTDYLFGRDRVLFEDIVHLNPCNIKILLKHINRHDLEYALTTMSEELRMVFFSNLSESLARIVRENIAHAIKIKIPSHEIHAAQKRIYEKLSELIKCGEITL